jgi:hypothetical protein
MVMAYALLAFQPRLIQAVSATWSSLGGAPAWALPTAAVGTIVTGASLGLMALSGIARGVQLAPYAWSAPILIGAVVIQAAQIDALLPISGLSVAVFAISSGVLMLVGGALLQLRGWPFKVSGVLLLVLPLLAILTSHALHLRANGDEWSALSPANRQLLVNQALALLATGLLAMTTRPPGASRNLVQQLERLKERTQRSEIRLAEAQRRAELAEQRVREPSTAAVPQISGTYPRPRRVSPSEPSAFVTGCALILVATLTAGYLFLYRPLLERAGLQRAQLIDAAGRRELTLEAARREFDLERRQLEAALSELRSKPPASMLPTSKRVKGATHTETAVDR